VTDKEDGVELEIDNEYIFSAKDLCTIDFLDKVMNTGISTLKIEGRGRSEDYVYITTKCYREAINSVKDGSYSQEKVAAWKKQLGTVYNRGFWDGYYLGRKMGEWSNEYGSQATKKRIYAGKGMNYFDNIKVGEFLLESPQLSVNDEIMISGPTTGLIQTTVKELRVDGKPCDVVKRGELFSMPVESKIRPSDKIYKVVDK
jgi:putative protease